MNGMFTSCTETTTALKNGRVPMSERFRNAVLGIQRTKIHSPKIMERNRAQVIRWRFLLRGFVEARILPEYPTDLGSVLSVP